MHIEWEETLFTGDLLSKGSTTGGILAGDGDIPFAGHLSFSLDLSLTPEERPVNSGFVKALEDYHRDAGASEQTLTNIGLLAGGRRPSSRGSRRGCSADPFSPFSRRRRLSGSPKS